MAIKEINCNCCGNLHSVSYQTSKNSYVCFDCKQAVMMWNKYKDTLKIEDEYLQVSFSPYNDTSLYRGFISSLRSLCSLLHIPGADCPRSYEGLNVNNTSYIWRAGDNVFTLLRSQVKIMSDMQKGVQDAGEESYKLGFKKGRDLLMSLHSGDLTLKDFEKEIKEVEEDD